MGKKEEGKKPVAAVHQPANDGKKSYLDMLKKPKPETPPPPSTPEPTANGTAPQPAAKKQPTRPPNPDELPTLGGVAPVIAEKPVWGPKKAAPVAALSAAADKEDKPATIEEVHAPEPEPPLNFKIVEAKTKKPKKGKHQSVGEKESAETAAAAEETEGATHPTEEPEPALADSTASHEPLETAVNGAESVEHTHTQEPGPATTAPESVVESHRPVSPPVVQATDVVVPHNLPPTESPFRRRSDPLDEEVPHRVAEPVRAPVSPPTASIGRKVNGNGTRVDWAASGWPLADGGEADSHYDVPTLPMPDSRHSTPSQSAQRARLEVAPSLPRAAGWRWVEGGADLEFPPSITAADQYYIRFAAPDPKFYDKEPPLNPRLAELAQRIEAEARALEEAKRQLQEEKVRMDNEAAKIAAERGKLEGEKQAIAQNQKKLKAEQDSSRIIADNVKREKERLETERAQLEEQRRMMAQGLSMVLGQPASDAPHPAPAPSHHATSHRPVRGGNHGNYGFDEMPQGSGGYSGNNSSGMGGSEWYPNNNGGYTDYGSYHANGSYGGAPSGVSRSNNPPFSSHPPAPQVQVGQPGMGRSGPIGPSPAYGAGKAPGMRARPMGEAHAYPPRGAPPSVPARHPAEFHPADQGFHW